MRDVSEQAPLRPAAARVRAHVSTVVVLLVWAGLAAPLAIWVVRDASVLSACFAAATALLWVCGGRATALWLRAVMLPAAGSIGDGGPSRIALLYCVCDHIDADAVLTSSRQDVAVDVVVLDDSRDPDVVRRIDALGRRHGWRVLRRADRAGFKAGNLNAGVKALRGQYDAFLVCDSDVVLGPDVARLCAAALADETVAVAQAAPTAAPGRTAFARYFGPLLDTHLGTTRRGRAAHGVTAFLGRGALVRAAAIEDVGGFPQVVAEDLAMTVALRRRGWRIVDVDTSFTEDYPIDYGAFRVQMRKTAEGAVELLRHPRWVRGLDFRVRADLLLETALVPAAALAGAATLVTGAALAGAGTPPPWWAMVVSALAAAAPLLPEAVRRARSIRPAAGLAFVLVAGMLYASTTFVVLSAVLRTAGGRRATFWVTPKAARRGGFGPTMSLMRDELVLVPVVAAVAFIASGSPLALVGPAGPALLALLFATGAFGVIHRSPVRDLLSGGSPEHLAGRRARPAASLRGRALVG